MSFISKIIQAFNWLKNGFVSHVQDANKIAVVVTETVKTLLANPITGFLLNIADAVTGTQVPSNIATAINAGIIKVLAVELGIQGLPDSPTPAQILAFENQILGVFNVNANNSKLYTVLAAQVYGIVQEHIDSGNTNFSGWVDAVEQAYTLYQKDLAANAVVASTPIVVLDANLSAPETAV